tara:strand:+ start:2820 stop:3407 length:588 start_codon:yes stop_codon:yes gene_type:complete
MDKKNMKKVFLDLGACTGESVKMFNDKWSDSSEFEIHSFEALPNNFKKLSETFGNWKNITLHQSVVYTADTTVKFHTGTKYSSSIRSDKITGGVRVDKYINVSSIDIAKFITDNFSKNDYIIMKMDIEGAEYEILPHLLNTNVLQDYVNKLYGEWHLGKLKNLKKEVHDNLVTELKSHGFNMKNWSAISLKLDKK